jgi:spermidine synthase
MIFLTLGYYLGGALADRYPRHTVLGGLVLLAGIITLALPIASTPILQAAWRVTPRVGILVGSLLGTFALFSLPTMLLGCVCPFAMKLSIMNLGRTGRTSGHIYAVSAMGGVVGTFLPAIVTIPVLGVRRSIMVFGAALVVAALLLLWRTKAAPGLAPLLLLLVPLGPMLPAHGVIDRRESSYSYLQVAQIEDTRLLIVDWGGFSVYTPGEFRTHEYYDYLLMAPLLRRQPPSQWLSRVLIVGLGAGTASKQISQCYGPLEIDGVEIDPEIVALGRQFFAMNEPNLRVHVTDGRAFLAQAREPYDWVIVDAYQGSDIPFHLTTREFFQTLRRHMSANGVLSINVAWWQPDDPELLLRLAATVGTVFPKVALTTGISRQSGAVLLAGGNDLSVANMAANAAAAGHAELVEIAGEILNPNPPDLTFADSRTHSAGFLFTDDRAPVEEIADRMYRERRQQAYQRERSVLGL